MIYFFETAAVCYPRITEIVDAVILQLVKGSEIKIKIVRVAQVQFSSIIQPSLIRLYLTQQCEYLIL